MAAGLGFKTFTTGEVLTAADVNGYLMQGILVFATEAARNSAITSPQEGQFAFTKDNNSLWYYTGSAWVASGATGDIEGVTAGVGISGGGTSGTVTITNDMATTITASGDIVVGTGSGTYDNLPIGSTGQVLTADTTVSPYKVKWAAAAGGGSWTQAATGSLTGTSVTVSGLSGKQYYVYLEGWSHSASSEYVQIRFNGDTANNYRTGDSDVAISNVYLNGTTTYAATATRSSGAYINMADTSMSRKPFLSMTPNSTNGSASGWYVSSSAITSITIFPSGGNFDAGTYYVWSFA